MQHDINAANVGSPFTWARAPRVWLFLLFGLFVATIGLGIALVPISTLIASAVLFLIVLTFIRPVVGVYLCTAFGGFEMLYIEYDPPHRALADHYDMPIIPIIVVFLVFLARKFIIPGNATWRDRSFYVLPLAWLIWAAVSILWTLDFTHWMNIMWAMSGGIMLMILLNEVIDTQKDLERFVDFLAILGIVLASVTAASLYTGVIKQKWELGHDLSFVAAVWMHGERRPSGFAHSAESSSALVFYIFMIIASFARAGWLKRIFLFVTGLLVLSMMLLIGAKAAIGGLLVGTALIILALPSLQKHAIRNGIIALVLLVTVYGVQSLCISIGNNLTDNSDVAEYSFSVRVGYWKTAFAYVKHRWIGTGTGGLAPVLDPAVNIHSMYFCVLCELGIVGLLIFVGFLVGGLRRIFRAYSRCGNERLRMILCCAAAGIVSICIHALVDVFQEQLYFWLVVSLVCIVCRLCVKSGDVTDAALSGPKPSPHHQDSEILV